MESQNMKKFLVFFYYLMSCLYLKMYLFKQICAHKEIKTSCNDSGGSLHAFSPFHSPVPQVFELAGRGDD